MQRIEPLREHRVARRLDLGPAFGVRLVRLDHRRHPVRDRLAAHLDLERCLEIGRPGLQVAGDRPEVTVEGELVQVAEPRLLLIITERIGLAGALASPARLPDALDRLALEEASVPLVDRFHGQIGLVAGSLQVVLAVDLLEEDLRLAPVFVEIPGHARLQR